MEAGLDPDTDPHRSGKSDPDSDPQKNGRSLKDAHKGATLQGRVVYLPEVVVLLVLVLGCNSSKGTGEGNKRTGTDCLFTIK